MDNTLMAIVQELGPRKLITVPASSSVAHAASVLAAHDIGAVVVETEDALVGGIFTERDLLRRVMVSGLDVERTPISLVMTREVRFVPSHTTVQAALALMLKEHLRHLLVIDGPQVHGLLSMRDLAQQLVRYGAGRFESGVREKMK